MAYLKPDIYKQSIFDIDYKKLLKSNIKCLVFDLDNTLGLIDEEYCPDKTKKLIKKLKRDFLVIIISNNTEKRIAKYKNELELDAVSFAMKPLTVGLGKIKKRYNLEKNEMLMIGDQLVTDILSGKLFGIKTALVEPFGKKDLKITSLNRKIENNIIEKYRKKGIFERGKYYE